MTDEVHKVREEAQADLRESINMAAAAQKTFEHAEAYRQGANASIAQAMMQIAEFERFMRSLTEETIPAGSWFVIRVLPGQQLRGHEITETVHVEVTLEAGDIFEGNGIVRPKPNLPIAWAAADPIVFKPLELHADENLIGEIGDRWVELTGADYAIDAINPPREGPIGLVED